MRLMYISHTYINSQFEPYLRHTWHLKGVDSITFR